VLTCGGNRAGGQARRRPAAAAATALIPTNRRFGLDNKRGGKLWWCKRNGAVNSRGHRASRDKELAVRPLMAGAAALAVAREGEDRPTFIGSVPWGRGHRVV
jgi:hypothetical protein